MILGSFRILLDIFRIPYIKSWSLKPIVLEPDEMMKLGLLVAKWSSKVLDLLVVLVGFLISCLNWYCL